MVDETNAAYMSGVLSDAWRMRDAAALSVNAKYWPVRRHDCDSVAAAVPDCRPTLRCITSPNSAAVAR